MAAGLYDITNEILGKGHFAIVKLARHCLTGEHVAIKIVDKSKLTNEGLEQLSCEIKLWSMLSRNEHPNVVKLYQCIDTRTKLYLVMEYCGNDVCDLYDHIQKKNDGNGLDEDEAKHIFRQICQAIFYCHSMKIVHRDLKPENILIVNNNTKRNDIDEKSNIIVKLIDFGFSNQWCEDEMLRTSCGSLAYSAPEILLGNHYDGPKVDIWALGCILYILLYGHNPFMQFNDNETLIKILDCSFTTPEKSTISDSSISLIKSLLKKDPNSRLSIEELVNHPWLRDKNYKFVNDFTKNDLRYKNFVHEHIIDQMIKQGIGVSKDVIKMIVKNEHIEETLKSNEKNEKDFYYTMTSINDHHYIKATYHLLKDKSTREFKGIDTNSQIKYRQNKRGNITKNRNEINARNINQDKKILLMKNSLNLTSPNLELPQNSLSYVLPLARKCSIVSEEGSICNENNIPENFNFERMHSPNTQHAIDIFVTDASDITKIDISEKIPENLETNQTSFGIKSIDEETCATPTKIEAILHPVSSSPDFLQTQNNQDIKKSSICDSEDGFIGDNFSITNEQTLFIPYNAKAKDKKLMNNVRIAGKTPSTPSSKLNCDSSSSVSNNKLNSTPSVRVIIQSKSLNNIAFIEANNTVDSNVNNISKLTNSISTINIKGQNRSEKNDCCSII